MLLDREYVCPICDTGFTSKSIMSGKNRVNGRDVDLRGRYEPTDQEKYEVLMCPKCGHAAMTMYFSNCPKRKIAEVRQWMRPEPEPENPSYYTYEMAYARIRAAMKDAMIREAKPSETGYIALHTAWLLRGYREAMEALKESGDSPAVQKKCDELADAERRYIEMAAERFNQAITSENFPICGMDDGIFQYLLAALHYEIGKYAEAARMLMPVLQNRATKPNLRVKAEDLRDEIRASQKKKS